MRRSASCAPYFQGVEWEFKPKENVQLAERLARFLEFQGEDAEHVPMHGECYMLAFRGYAYWFFTWGPVGDREMVAPEWDGLREQFSLLDGARDGRRNHAGRIPCREPRPGTT